MTFPFTTRPELAGTFGMVASTHWLASAAGMAVLEQDGNAFDAAVAAGLVLQVVEPHLNGPGGEVPVIGFDAARGEAFVLCGQGPAPAAATLAAFGLLGLDLVPGNGLLAACVPAAFGTWMMLLRDHGRLPLRSVMEHAIGYAAGGYPVLPAISAGIASVAELFRAHWPSSAEIYLAGDGASGVPAPGPGSPIPCWPRPTGASWPRPRPRGRTGTSRSRRRGGRSTPGSSPRPSRATWPGREVLDVTGQRHRALLGYDDLAALAARRRAAGEPGLPRADRVQDPALGAGPGVLAAAGAAVRVRPGRHGRRAAPSSSIPWWSAPSWPSRTGRRGTATRGSPMSRSATCSRPGTRRSAASWSATWPGPAWSRGRPAAAPPGCPRSRRPRPGRPAPAPPPLDPGTGEPLSRAGGAAPVAGDTCHLDVADRFGNLVSATPSGGWLQSSPVIPGLGFCLGTRAQMFTLTPGLPGTLAPGKRPRTTLSPGLVLRDGEPYLAFGTPGGDQQDQWTVPFFVNHVQFGMNLQQAIDAPAFHTRHFPSSFYPRESCPLAVNVEERAGPDVIAALRARGHEVTVVPPWSLGRISAVARSGGFLYAAANPRGMQGYAAGR